MRVTDSMIIKGVHDYVVLLERGHHFRYEDPVTIITSDDFRLMQEIYLEMKSDKKNLTKQIENQNKYIAILEQRLIEDMDYNLSNRLITYLTGE
ncbi:MAG: hypothetical protein LUQ24_01070 [Methanobacterium sp.]|nr:hypothetical protein [Methanobacterium sp.]